MNWKSTKGARQLMTSIGQSVATKTRNMIRAARQRAFRCFKMGTISFPAPVGGWNARDDLGNMPPEDAVVLRNWRPRPGYLETRNGTSVTAASVDSAGHDSIGTIATFRSKFGDILIFSGGNKLYGWDGGDTAPVVTTVYDGGDDTGATFWDSAHFQNRLIMTLGNGSDPAQVVTYDGSTISSSDLNITTGPNEEDIRGVQVHKGRAYYWETASQSFWYAAAGAFQGDLTEFDLGPVLKYGGALQMMVTISIDGGGGKDDLAAFIFSSGEVLLYQGDDPGDSSAWELVGSFRIAQTVDPQAHEKLGGTELIYTQDGVVDISTALQTDRFGMADEFTEKITTAAKEAAADYVENSGWQIVHAPGDDCVLINIPKGDGEYVQYIRQTDSGSWWESTNWDMRFTVFNDKLHGVYLRGTIIEIYECFSGDSLTAQDAHDVDNFGYIKTACIPAYTAMRKPSLRKVLTTVKPSTNVRQTDKIIINGLSDFDETVPAFSSSNLLDGVIVERTQPNISVCANGFFLSYSMQIEFRFGVIRWNSSTLFYGNGGPV